MFPRHGWRMPTSTEYQVWMERCIRCPNKVPEDDFLGLCEDCLAQLRDDGYVKKYQVYVEKPPPGAEDLL